MDTATFLLERSKIERRLQNRRDEIAYIHKETARGSSLWNIAGWVMSKALQKPTRSFFNELLKIGATRLAFSAIGQFGLQRFLPEKLVKKFI